MFSYYGSKSKVVDYYPPPKYKRIIEPFAGSARYSLKYWDHDVLLVDKYDVIVKIWHYLQQCVPEDIDLLPELKHGEDLRDYDIRDESLLLMRLLVGGGLFCPQWKVSPQGYGGDIKTKKKAIKRNLHKIKHWVIKQGDYLDLKNEEATWFIDPPYQFGGHKYIESNKNIDYIELAQWSMDRSGQVIVCENTKATWMDFKPMKEMNGTMFKTTEAIWSNIPTSFDWQQSKLF